MTNLLDSAGVLDDAKAAISPPDTFIYLGTRWTADGGTTHKILACREIDGQWTIAQEVPHSFGKKRKDAFGSFLTGRIYRIPNNGALFQLGLAESLGPWPDADDRQGWATQERASETARVSASKSAALVKEDVDLVQILKPLRAHYEKCRGATERCAFELLVLDALRKGRGPLR